MTTPLDAAVQKLATLLESPNGRATAVSSAAIDDARALLVRTHVLGIPIPVVRSVGTGGVVLEWFLPGVEIRLELGPDGRAVANLDVPVDDLAPIQDAIVSIVRAAEERMDAT